MDNSRAKKLKDKKKKQIKDRDVITNSYRSWSEEVSFEDLMRFMESQSETMTLMAKRRIDVVDGQVVKLDSGDVESLLYKSAGIDIIREYLKNKLN